jgi:hypothetical protein
MKSLSRTFSRCIGSLVVCALLAPPMAIASPKPLTAEKAHARIFKLGLGNWVGVQVVSGAAFAGRIVRIDDDSFGLQLHNDPRITSVQYGDVVHIDTGISRRTALIVAGIGTAGMVVIALVAHHEMENNKPQMPTTTTPLFFHKRPPE